MRRDNFSYLRHTNAITIKPGKWFLLVALAAFLLGIPSVVAADPDKERRTSERVAALLGQMTLTEKIGQLNLVSQGEPVVGQLDAVRTGRIGTMMNVVDPAIIARYKQAARESRNKIPLLFGLDAIDVFRIALPPPIAWAATWKPELAQAAARAVASETAATGVNWTFAPMIDISRDPRWGRVIEGAGEDAYLGSVMAAARTRGYQSGGLIATAKHYVGYGAGEAGRDYNNALIPVSDLYDRYLPPFKAAFDAGAPTVMAALNAVNGVPATANSYLLKTVLRRSLGFRGFVTADYNAIGELKNHGLAADLAAASRIALNAGIDMDMEGVGFIDHLEDELKAGRIKLASIDAAVTRVLTVKFNSGLFEEKPVPVAPPESEIRGVARQVARESIVLLKNDGATLPISASIKTIALIGAAAKSDYDESWYGPAMLTKPDTKSLYDALAGHLRAHQSLLYAPAFTDPCAKTLGNAPEAIETAARADFIVMVVSEDCEFSGEGASRTNLDLSLPQQDVFDKLAALGKPLVLIVTAGRPLTIARQATKADAILYAWLPRTEGRVALAEILTGETSPSGKLPMTIPRSVGQIPISYNVLPTSRPANENRFTSRYLDEAVTPLYPFGHGLSFTTFDYTKLRALSSSLTNNGTVAIDVDVTNTGSRSGDEVVQLYIRRPVASRSRPLRELKGFQKIRLRPGETQTVRFNLKATDLAFHDDAGKLIIEPGPVELFAGGSSTATLSTAIALQ
ncbi:MAG: glycoside hydrolase family 3 N-terminal domain-containing protein [Hyphomicrobiaceae bacterium]